MQAQILKTLAYADAFDYPLTITEIQHWLIGQKANTSEVARLLATTPRTVKSQNGYYFLKGRQNLVKRRQLRHTASVKKLKLAQKVGDWLKFIPTIQLIAVTGALAMHNSDPEDDIDFIIITSANTLWLTRIFVVVLLEILCLRRKPGANRFNNKICLNLWLDESALTVPQNQHNLYTAHEVAQIQPLWDKNNTYQKFLSANRWIKSYLPNIRIPISPISLIGPINPILRLLNQVAYKLQYLYMRPKITREKVFPHFAFFHPRDTTMVVMQQYRRRLVKLGLKP